MDEQEDALSNGTLPNSKLGDEDYDQQIIGNLKDTNSSISKSNSNHKNEQLNKKHHNTPNSNRTKESNPKHIEDYQYIEQNVPSPLKSHSINDYAVENYINDQQEKSFKSSNGVTASDTSGKKLSSQNENITNNSKRTKTANSSSSSGKENLPNFTNNKEEVINR